MIMQENACIRAFGHSYQVAYPELNHVEDLLFRGAVHLGNSVVCSGLLCATLLHFGYPFPVRHKVIHNGG